MPLKCARPAYPATSLAPTRSSMEKVPPEHDVVSGIAVEGAADFFFGRPLDANPDSRADAADGWESWRFGWTEASHLEQLRGKEERRRWRTT